MSDKSEGWSTIRYLHFYDKGGEYHIFIVITDLMLDRKYIAVDERMLCVNEIRLWGI